MSTIWYVEKGGGRSGPFSTAQLKDQVGRGQLSPTDLVLKEGMAKPVPARKVKGLFPETPTGSNPDHQPSKALPAPPPLPVDAGQTVSSLAAQRVRPVPYTFVDWYKQKFSFLPVIVHIPLWLVYGFAWIPAWYLIHQSRQVIDGVPPGKKKYLLVCALWPIVGQLLWMIYLVACWLRGCPACKRWDASVLLGRDLLAREGGYGTVMRTDQHYDAHGRSLGSTNRLEQVHVTTDTIHDTFQCRFCNHRWASTYVRQYQG